MYSLKQNRTTLQVISLRTKARELKRQASPHVICDGCQVCSRH